MPPAPFAPDAMEVGHETGPTEPAVAMPAKPTMLSTFSSLFPRYMFAWELNIVSAAVLGLVYSRLPEEYEFFFYGFLAVIAFDAVNYYMKRGSMAGVPYTLPMLSLISMLVHPVRFWAEQGALAMESKEGMSSNTLVGKFMIFVTDPKLVKAIFTGEGTYQLYAHPNAKWLFGANNLIYMPTEAHKRFRALLTPALFSNDALTMYARAQEGVVRKYLAKYAEESQGKPYDARIAFRSIGAVASQESFLGPYLNDAMRDHLEKDILCFTNGFLCFPFPYLGSGLAQAIAAKLRIQDTILSLIPAARSYIRAGNTPRCLLEHWTLAIMEAAQDQGVKPEELPGCNDRDVAITVMDFLFAAQDATNSALTFAVDVLHTRPDVVSKIREEVAACKGKEIWSMVRDSDQLRYTTRAAVQMLHHKPPVPMVPHLALKDAVLGGRKIHKGTVLIPSIAYSARMSGASREYDPDRKETDNMFLKNMVFGGGQHKCPGRRYAESLLTVFLAVCINDYDFERVGERPALNDIMYYPTLFPAQNNFIIQPRA